MSETRKKKLQACRLCLITNVNMTPIGDPVLTNFLENLLESNGYKQNFSIRNFVCYVCKASLQKTHTFVQRAITAQMKMNELLVEKIPLKAKDLYGIDRKALGFFSGLEYHKVEVDFTFTDSKDVPEDDVIKQELSSDVDYCDEEFSINEVKEDDDQHSNRDSEINDMEVDSPKLENFKNSHKGSQNIDPLATKIELPDSNNKEKKKYRYIRPKGVQLSTDNIISYGRKRILKSNHIVDDSINNKHFNDDLNSHDSGSESDKTKMRGKKRLPSDEEFNPQTQTESETETDSEDSFDDDGKPIKRIKETREYPRKCDHCDVIIPEVKLHYRHYLINHENEEYPYHLPAIHVCQYCGKSYRTTFRLKHHEKVHLGKKEIPCPDCDKKFYNINHLYRHKQRVHRGRSVFCDFCNKGFARKLDLIRHLRMHTGEKPYKCPICTARFTLKGNIKIHIKTHHEVLNKAKRSKKRNRKQQKQKKDAKGAR